MYYLLFCLQSKVVNFYALIFLCSEYFTKKESKNMSFRTILYDVLSSKFVKHVCGSFSIVVCINCTVETISESGLKFPKVL